MSSQLGSLMQLLELDGGWLGLEWSEGSAGLDIQDGSFPPMSGASAEMTEIAGDFLPHGFSMLPAWTVSACPRKLFRLLTWLLIFTRESIPRDQSRSFKASSDLASKVTHCFFWKILLVAQGQPRFSRERGCTKL